MMDWDALRVVLAVAEGGSFSAAARRLRISQPTVGRRIAEIETRLASRLFDRSARRMTLTPAGEIMVAAARRMEAEADAVSRQLAGHDRQLTGSVRISSTEGLGVGWLTPRLAGLREALPGIDIEMVIDNAAVNLSKREADIAVRLRHDRTEGRQVFDDQTNLVGRKVGVLAFALYASDAYLDSRGAPQTPDDLATHQTIGFDEGESRLDYATWYTRLTQPARTVYRSNSLLAQIAAARAGWGIAIIARVLGDAEPDLRPVLPGLRIPSLDIWLVTHADLQRTARIRAVVDVLAGLFDAEADKLAGRTAAIPR